jgi:proton-translocating NADH-quinone oxidoreductase chain L
MPTPATLLIIATLLPLVSFGVLLFAGKRIGSPLAGVIGTALVGGSFACSMGALIAWLNVDPATPWGAGKAPINLPVRWIPTGAGVNQDHPGFLDLGVYVDSLTVAMFAMITTVATAVHVFSIGYLRGDKRFPRFFTYLGLFCFSMLGLVLGGTLLQLFVFWELVGLCSYLLIGFWYEKKSASNAATKAFVVNRVGDLGFLVGFGVLFYHLGNATLPHVWATLGAAGQGADVALPGGGVFTVGSLTLMGIGLFCGAIGKSAQFPLHTWLPDAMEGPTPVSALIHAATMVAAGVYLCGRIFPILTPDAKLFIAIIGCVTLTMAALIAVAQTDIKRVLAYSTISQLGYMMLAIGLGSWVGGLFHLITHAFFKSLLFLGAGSVIRAARHEQEMSQFGGLAWRIPVTAGTFAIGVLAIAGTPFFAGFYSKDMILTHAASFGLLSGQSGGPQWHLLFFYVPTAVAYLTAFYMTRCWMLTFWGKPRNQHLFNHARETALLYVPLLLLAALSTRVGAKGLGILDLIERSVVETNAVCASLTGKADFPGFTTAWPASLPHDEESMADVASLTPSQRVMGRGLQMTHSYARWGWLIGIALGFLVYVRGFLIADALMKIPPFRWVNIWLYRGMYFDELYHLLVVGTTKLAAEVVRVFDTYVVDGVVSLAARATRGAAGLAGLNDEYVVDAAASGIGNFANDVGTAVRVPQTGRVRTYVMVLLGCVGFGLAAAVLVAMMMRSNGL